MTVHEYNELKRRRANLSITIKENKGKYPAQSILLQQLNEQIIAAGNEQCIQEYLDVQKRKSRLLQTIGSWKFHKKDTTKLEEQLSHLKERLNEMESSIIDKQLIPQQVPQSVLQPTTQSDPVYYIINLAWSKGDEDLLALTTVKEFLDRTDYINFEHRTYVTCGQQEMYTWKFNYDTVEEIARAKAFHKCATHLLDVMKMKYSTQTDAELFGKVQKY